MRLAIGVILTAGYAPPHEFYWGRADHQGPAEGLFAMAQRINSGTANTELPRDLQLTGMRVVKSSKFPTDVARNEICRSVLDGDEDYLLFLDADMVHPATLAEDLIRVRADVITARYHLKKAPFAAVAYVKHRTQDGPHRYASIHFGRGVIEIERGGGGALLIHRSVLQAIHDRQVADWTALLASPAHQALPDWARGYLPREPIVQWFRYQQGPKAPHDLSVSEDFWFWQQARECGFETLCQWDIDCPHVGQMAIDGSWNTPFLNQQISEYAKPEHRQMVLENTIVCGYRDGLHLGDDAHVPEYAITAGER
jgi:hypothetical protein